MGYHLHGNTTASQVETPEGFDVVPGTSIQLHFSPLKVQTGWMPLLRESTEGTEQLAHVTVTFVFRHGVFSDVSAITYERRYARHVKTVELEYVWRPEKHGDPERGVVLAYVFSLLALVAIALRVTSSTRFAKALRVMSLRHRDD